MQPPDKEKAALGGAALQNNLHSYPAINYRSLQDQIRRYGKSIIGDCPRCGYKNALSVTENNGRRLYYCHAGCDQADLWAVVRNVDAVSNWRPVHHAEVPPVDKGLDDYIRQLWQSSQPAREMPVQVYLNERGITDIPPSIRCLPHHRHTPTGTYCPVMLSAVVDHAGRLRALHRTYITANGKKAPVAPAKMTLGVVGGYATHLAKAGERLAVAEGIETSLSVMQSTGIPAWAALSAGGIEHLILPPLPLAREVLICADNDANGRGQRAADTAATRWYAEGRSVRIATPPQAGKDFNDLLREVSL